jgi:hypothetical protein
MKPHDVYNTVRLAWEEGKVLDQQSGRLVKPPRLPRGKVSTQLRELVQTGRQDDLLPSIARLPAKESLALIREFSGKVENLAGDTVLVPGPSAGSVFLHWFKKNILGSVESSGENFEVPGQKDIRFDNFLKAADATKLSGRVRGFASGGKPNVFELKNFMYETKQFGDPEFFEQAQRYAEFAKKKGFQLNYVFSQKVKNVGAITRLRELGIKVWVITDEGEMVPYNP